MADYIIDGKSYREGRVLNEGRTLGQCLEYLMREQFEERRSGIYERKGEFAAIVSRDLRRFVVRLERI